MVIQRKKIGYILHLLLLKNKKLQVLQCPVLKLEFAIL